MVSGLHAFEVLNAGITVGTVVVKSDIIRRVRGDKTHELFEPSLPILVIRDRWPNQLLPLMLSQRYHLVVPRLRRALRRDIILVRLVEEMDDGLVAVEDILPVGAGELGFEMDHGAKRSAAMELGGNPGVPVADGGERALEIALVHGPRDAGIAGSGAVGPVPEEAALLHYHIDRKNDFLFKRGYVRGSLFR